MNKGEVLYRDWFLCRKNYDESLNKISCLNYSENAKDFITDFNRLPEKVKEAYITLGEYLNVW